MIKIPPYLEKGDTIGIVAPAGFMPVEKMQACIETLDSWGYTPELGSTTHSDSLNYSFNEVLSMLTSSVYATPIFKA